MDYDLVAFTDELKHLLERWTVHILAGDLVGEGLVQVDPFELPVRILVFLGYPDVSGPLPLHKTSNPGENVRIGSKTFSKPCQERLKITLT